MAKYKRRYGFAFTLIFVVLLSMLHCSFGASLPDQLRERIRTRIETSGFPPVLNVQGERINASTILPLYYERNAYSPAWIDETGVRKSCQKLLLSINASNDDGLRPADYHAIVIDKLLKELSLPSARKSETYLERLTDLELLSTDAFLILGSHMLAGKVDPQTIDPEWFVNRREADFVTILADASKSGDPGIALSGLLPTNPAYAALRRMLQRYRIIESTGGWESIPEGSKLQKGDDNQRVVFLRRRLAATGDAVSTSSQSTIFDEDLEKAVMQFQNRHGLEADGVAGVSTLASLNVPVSERIKQIELNLERWRWLPQALGDRYVIVNIANFELDVIEKGNRILEMKAIVGRDYRRTPVFSDKVTYLVLSPFWNVPNSIAVQDILPMLKKDPDYLKKKNLKVFPSNGNFSNAIEPSSIDWKNVSAAAFPYKLRQDPGPDNALGEVKFMFPNQFNVYMHDTPARELFAKTDRAFSSGCIRLEKPIDLAVYLLKDSPGWSKEKIREVVLKRVEQTVKLPQMMPIYILYWTAWVDDSSVLHFRKDLYNRDKPLAEALREKPPLN